MSGVVWYGLGTCVLLGCGGKVMLPVIGGLFPVTRLNEGAGVGCLHCIILQHGSAGSETIWQLGGGTTPSMDGHLQKGRHRSDCQNIGQKDQLVKSLLKKIGRAHV